MFYQLYSIHVSLSGIAPACIYAFLPNKTEKTYHRFSEALKILVPDSRPEKILLDFEQAAIQAFQKNFPETKLSGCFFHLSQSFMRKIGELGLKKDYETNHEFALALKLLPALAFEKEEEIRNSYDKIVEEIQIVCDRTIKESEKWRKLTSFAFILDLTTKKVSSRVGKPYSPFIMESKGCGTIGFGQNNKSCRGLALWHTVLLQWIASQYMESDCKFAKRRVRPKT